MALRPLNICACASRLDDFVCLFCGDWPLVSYDNVVDYLAVDEHYYMFARDYEFTDWYG